MFSVRRTEKFTLDVSGGLIPLRFPTEVVLETHIFVDAFTQSLSRYTQRDKIVGNAIQRHDYDVDPHKSPIESYSIEDFNDSAFDNPAKGNLCITTLLANIFESEQACGLIRLRPSHSQ